MDSLYKPDEVSKLMLEVYNMHVVHMQILDGYEDLNVRLRTSATPNEELHDIVLKLSPLVDWRVASSVELQTAMMLHLTDHGIRVSKVIPTASGSLYFTHELDSGRKFVGRLLTFIPGTTLAQIDNPLPILEDIGRFVGEMSTILKDFRPNNHENIITEWGLTKAPLLRDMLTKYCPRDLQKVALDILQDYDTKLLPTLSKFQTGYIHSDIIRSNILVSKGRSEYTISGIIDFGDACLGNYVYEIAIIMADMMAQCPRSRLEVGRRLLKGFCSKFKLSKEELSCLRLCICIRILQCCILTEKAAIANPKNRTYIARYRAPYMSSCNFLWNLGETDFQNEVVSIVRPVDHTVKI